MLNVCRQTRHDVKGKGNGGGGSRVNDPPSERMLQNWPLPPYNDMQRKRPFCKFLKQKSVKAFACLAITLCKDNKFNRNWLGLSHLYSFVLFGVKTCGAKDYICRFLASRSLKSWIQKEKDKYRIYIAQKNMECLGSYWWPVLVHLKKTFAFLLTTSVVC